KIRSAAQARTKSSHFGFTLTSKNSDIFRLGFGGAYGAAVNPCRHDAKIKPSIIARVTSLNNFFELVVAKIGHAQRITKTARRVWQFSDMTLLQANFDLFKAAITN